MTTAPRRPGERPTTILLRGGHVYTPTDPAATAMLVTGDTVAWVGSEGAARAHADVADVVVPLDGALVTPAFVDAHVHATATGLALRGLDLSGARSLAEALARVEQHSRGHRGGAVLGHGWDDSRWPERRPPTRRELDRAAYGGVVYLSRVDAHSAVVSSALVAAAPEIRAAAGYDASGPLTGEAHHAARRVAHADLSPERRRTAQRTTRARAAALGIGSLHEMGGPDVAGDDDLRELLALATAEPGPDVVAYWGEPGGVATARALGARGAGGDLFADGSLGSRTAALRAPYADAEHRGRAFLDAARVRDHVVSCVEAGLQPGFHAIGDGALDTVTAGLEEAAARMGADRVRMVRPRLEHAEMLDTDLLARLVRLGAYASVQPAFDAAWGGPDGMYAERLGPARALRLNPFAAMAAAGLPLAFGSDAPVTPLDPWGAVRAAVFHHDPAARLTVRAAFAAHTRGGWRAAGRDDGGVLIPGAAATYAVWRADDLRVQAPEERVANWSTDPRGGVPGLPAVAPGLEPPTCLRTVVRGVTVYDPEGAPA